MESKLLRRAKTGNEAGGKGDSDMKKRPLYYLSDEHISHNSEAFDYIKELHEYLWTIIRIVKPGASGQINDYLDEVITKIKPHLEESERSLFWENTAKISQDSSDYYQDELVKAHALLGRVIHQMSERWDTVNLTKYYPTDNLHRRRNVGNPTGKKT